MQQLQRASEGDREAFDAVFSTVYRELRALASTQRRRWDGNYTLDTTALVHEAYLKLVGGDHASWRDVPHFLAVAARAMRHILVNYAERQRAAKRGGGRDPLSIEDANPVGPEAAEEILSLNEALQRLEAVSERQARVVEARFFAGYSIEDTAALLGTSPATVKRDWALASSWLFREVRAPGPQPPP